MHVCEAAAALCPDLNVALTHHSLVSGGCLCFPVPREVCRQIRAGALRYTDLRERHLIRRAAELPTASLIIFSLMALHPRIFARLFVYLFEQLTRSVWSPESYLAAYVTLPEDAALAQALEMTVCYEMAAEHGRYHSEFTPCLYAIRLPELMQRFHA